MVEISTSILSVQKEGAIKKFYNLEAAHTNYFHIDVMDGEFVENNTKEIMLEYAETIKQISNTPLDVHLMVKDVQKYIEEYIPLEPNIITFHYEAVKNKEEILELINEIKRNNIRVGLAISPKTKPEEIYDLLPNIHILLVMTVEPGKGGQKLIPETIQKVQNAYDYINKNELEVDIQVDGGINEQTAQIVKEAGANILVAGNSILSSENYAEIIRKLK